MHPAKIKNVLAMSAKDRFEYFVRKVSDFEEVWGLFDKGWAIASDSDGSQLIPFWPEKGFAELCATGPWSGYSPTKIELGFFLDKWLVGMAKDGVCAGVFPTPLGKGVVISPNELREAINRETELYE